jgi:aminoglycoside phosphotransferase (APT) family kinase protein
MDEFKLLQLLQSEDLAAPLPIYVDESGEIFPTPYIVLHYIEGQTTFSPPNMDMFNYQLAEYISRVHRVDASKVDFLPYQAEYYAKNFKTRPEKVDDSLDEGKIRDVLETAWPLYQHNKNVLLHGDFWPGNILWDKGQIAAAIDWEDTNVGDPLGDISISRLEMLWAFGQEAMDNFTEQYKSLSDIDFTNLPYWDLCAALRPAFRIGDWAGNEVIEQRMREQHKVFVNQAFEKLGVH